MDFTSLNPACRGINQDPVLRLRIVIDPLNEPDSYTIRWEANATLHLPGASDLYLSVMDALYAINPATLFMIQVRLTMHQGLAYLRRVSLPAASTKPGL